MARKQTNSKESIIAGAVDLIDKYGTERFSVRNVAKHLQISTQPIYSYFKNSSDLYEGVLGEIEARMFEKIDASDSNFVFRNMGFGFMLFAIEKPNLFSTFFSPGDTNKLYVQGFKDKLREAMNMDERFIEISVLGKDDLLNKMWTFSYGYAFLIIGGFITEATVEDIKDLIVDVGTIMIQARLKTENLI